MSKESTPFSNLQLVNEFQEVSEPRQRALISLLAICDKHNLAATELVSSLANDLPRTPLENRRRTRNFYWSRVEEVSERIMDSDSPYEAIEQVPGVLPDYVNVAMRMEHEQGTQTDVSKAWLNRPPDYLFDNARPRSFVSVAVPLLFKMYIVIHLLVFIMIKIVPEFKAMLEEFEMEMPLVFAHSIAITDALVRIWYIPFLLIVLAAPFFIPAVAKYLKRWNPFGWQQQKQIRSVSNRQMLALNLAHGNRLDGIGDEVELAFDYEFENGRPAYVRQQPAPKNIDEADAETDWKKVRSRWRLSKKESQLMETAASPDVQSWLLRKSAGKKGQRNETRSVFLTRAWVTGVNVLIAIVVLAMGISIFATLIEIMVNLR